MSFKVLHTGDVHLGDLSGPTKDGENLRRLDTLRCMSDIVQKAQIVTPDITVIAGDLFNRSRVWADTALDDVNDAISGFLRPLCQHSHAVVLLFGTENHDNPRAFDVIKKATGDLKNLHIYTQPTVDTIPTPAGSIQILAVPGFDRGRLRTFFPGADKEAENQNATALVNQLVLGLATQLDPDLPSILTAHYTVTGCTTESGQSFLAGQDVVISTDTIDGANVSLACFGHIHNPQKLLCNTPAYYCGSPNQLTFNDEGIQHGFWIHTISDDSVTSTFHGTPERKHYTLRLNAQEITDFLSSGKALFPIEVKSAVVRVRYNCSAEQDKALNRAELQKAIMQAGAFYVAEILPEEIVALDAVDQLTEHDGPAEALERWLNLNDIPFETSTRLQELARPILAKADDGRNASKHTGAFVPISITVRNYRSYTDATFDFAPVRMAMVNGSNGVGKSSLFMDALADCLFEQSRQEDIGGWVRDGTKSGSITFCFEVGGTTYQVIRTRLRSGKGTLALQQKGEDGEWVDAGDTTMKLTQQKIIRLLGMDCNTFCSIALIRQDAYGLFLDADSDRRMEVLSALLGLDLYDRAEEMAKAGAADQRRKIAECNTRIGILDDQIREKPVLEEQRVKLAADMDQLENSLSTVNAGIQAAHEAEAARGAIKDSIDRAEARAATIGKQVAEKCNALNTINQQIAIAEAGAVQLEFARSAAQQLSVIRIQLDLHAGADDRYNENRRAASEAQTEADKLRSHITACEGDIIGFDSVLRNADSIRAKYARLQEINTQKAKAAETISQYAEAQEVVTELTFERDMVQNRWNTQISQIEADIERAEKNAAMLKSSGCSIPSGASCKFLSTATAAAGLLPVLRKKLEDAKANARQQYNDNTERIEKAKSNPILTGPNPHTLMSDLSKESLTLKGIESTYEQLGRAEERRAAALRTLEDLKQRLTDTLARIDQLNSKVADLMENKNRLEAARKAEKTLKATADTLPQCEADAAKIDSLKAQKAAMETDIGYLIQQKDEAMAEVRELNGKLDDTYTSNLDALTASRRYITNDISTTSAKQGEIAYKLDQIEAAEAQAADLRKEKDGYASALTDYQTLVKAFGLDGIRYMIVRSIVPEIMQRSNEILAAMTGGRMAVDIRTEREKKSDKKIVNSLEVWIHTISGGNRPYQSHSGGEKVKIALAVTLGLADVKARRAGVQLGMLFIDEPPFLDADGTDAYADALTAMAARNPDMRILAISHDPTMKARFPQNITVTGGENGSTVTME